MKYKAKPIIIDAIQYTWNNGTEILRFMFPDIEPDAEATIETIKTLEWEFHVSIWDYIIRWLKWEFYPCKPDIFDMKYKLIK